MAEKTFARPLLSLNILREGREIVMKEEQETATINLLRGQDVMAILPTWFGKSMIFTVFPLAIQELSSTRTCVLVISPLKCIFHAMELSTEAINLVRDDPPQFLYCLYCSAVKKL